MIIIIQLLSIFRPLHVIMSSQIRFISLENMMIQPIKLTWRMGM
jgi:hypothetical protein